MRDKIHESRLNESSPSAHQAALFSFSSPEDQQLTQWLSTRHFEPHAENLAQRITSQARPYPVAAKAPVRAVSWLPAWLTQREVMAYGLAMVCALLIGFQVSPQEVSAPLDPFQVAGGQLTQEGNLF